MVKSILRQFLNQEKAINSRNVAIEGILKWMKDHPVSFLWLIWILTLCLDFLIRFLGSTPFAPWKIILWNFIGWGLINQFWFFVFLPNVLFKKKWKLESLILIAAFLCYSLIKLSLIVSLTHYDIVYTSFLSNELVRSFQFLLNTSAIWGFYILTMSLEEYKKMEIDLIRLQVEHQSLQLSPHFVLNMISQFSASLLSISRPLFHSMNLFTEVLSYSYKNPRQENSLAQEIHALENYLACQRYRFGEKLQFNAVFPTVNSNSRELFLPKWTLMTLLENVFKHGDCFDISCPCILHCVLSEKNDEVFLSFVISNPLGSDHSKNSSQFGIDAVRRILSFYFSDQFQIFVQKSNTEFNILLSICYGKNSENRITG